MPVCIATQGVGMVQVSPEWRRRIDAIPDAVRAAAAREMERGAEELVAEMKRRVPVDSTPDNIHLRDGIGWTWGDAPAGTFSVSTIKSGADAGIEYAALTITIYSRTKDAKGRPYSSWVEFGTSRSRASPFFWPAYREHRRRIRSRILKAVREAIRHG